MTTNDEGGPMDELPPEGGSGPGKLQVVLGCTAGVVTLAIPVLLYLGLVGLLGFRDDPAVARLHLIVGSVASIVVTGIISLVGESLIEDVVKFVLIGGAFAFIARGQTPDIGAVTLGITVGTFMPLFLRVWTPFLGLLGLDTE